MDRKILEDSDRKKIKMKMQEGSKEFKFDNAIVKQCILASVEGCDDWRPSVAAEAFSLLERLTRNLIFNPERKLYHELKTYSGTYKHILSRLAMIDEVLREIGYKRDSNSYRLHRFNDNLESLMIDFMHAAILCEIMHDLYGLESIDNRRLMCKIRLDPGYLEHEESERRVVVENGCRPSPSSRVKFIEGDSYPNNSPKPRQPKDVSSSGWTTDKQLTRPRPRSILRHSGTSNAAASIPVDESEYRARSSVTVIPVEHYESQPRVFNESTHANIRVASIPPSYSTPSHRHSRPSPSSVDFRMEESHSSRTISNSNSGAGRQHYAPSVSDQEVIMRSSTSRSETHRRRSNHESASVSLRRDRTVTRPSSIADTHRHTGLSGYRR